MTNNLPKPLEMTDREILDFIQRKNIIIERQERESYCWWIVYCDEPEKWHIADRTLVQAVCQAAAILKEQEK